GASAYGTVFKIDPAGTLTALHSFNYSDGAYPHGTLIQASDGAFYGTTTMGGPSGFGTVYKIDAAGALTTLHGFNFSDGVDPYGARDNRQGHANRLGRVLRRIDVARDRDADRRYGRAAHDHAHQWFTYASRRVRRRHQLRPEHVRCGHPHRRAARDVHQSRGPCHERRPDPADYLDGG